MTELRISPDLTLPEDAVTRSFAILGMRGSGKSNAAVVMAEEMFRTHFQWVSIDPKGDWWGVRSSGDGKGPGLPVVIFGGEHADVPLEPTARAGVLVADLILNEGLTCVLDVSEFSKAGKIQFLAGQGAQEGFAERFFRKKKRESDPIHVFMEEAHDYLPQQARNEVGKLVEVVSRIQTMGRQRGLGCSALSQRSARLHNDVLTQVDTLIAMRTIAPPDREAIEKWVKGHGLSQELVRTLPELADGEAWVWSPEWLGILERVRFRRRETFDSGATPVRGAERRRPATLADVDLGAIEAQMKETIERAKADDPKELRKQLAAAQRDMRQLEQQLQAAKQGAHTEPITIEREVEVRVEVPVLPPESLQMVEDYERMVTVLHSQLDVSTALIAENVAKIRALAAGTQRMEEVRRAPSRPQNPPPKVKEQSPSRPQAERRPPPSTPVEFDGEVSPSEQKILDALAWWEAAGFEAPTRRQAGYVAGYRPGGRWNNLVSGMKSKGLIVYPQKRTLALTDGGRAFADVPLSPPSAMEMQSHVMAILPPSEQKVLRALLDAYPNDVSREELMAATGYQPGGRFNNLVSGLKSLGLVYYPDQGHVAAEPFLFMEADR